MLFLPPMTGNFGTGSQKYTTYKNADDCDDWGPTNLGPSLLPSGYLT